MFFIPGVQSDAVLSQTDSPIHRKPNESFKLTCQGSGFDFSKHGMHWIRQDSERRLQWLGVIWFDASKTVYAPSVEGRVTITRDNKNNITSLELRSLVTADSARYFCARPTPTVLQTVVPPPPSPHPKKELST
ncbi:hypothetical protein GDO78_014489 [Eleutherodactylus coqui]|uniref:Ig-like domain-containing protein n=1 Tax=Eleutherodactylus coqui TaxID=57060 RepID=A0A8J6C3V5_ELECQ|nr:hypothetical protein GDO78_014489 [Eleutherodactylus coqui]